MISNKTATIEASAGLGRAEVRNQKPEIKPDWWVALPTGERSVIRAVAKVLREAKASESLEMARAAAKWERALGCFIKVRLKGERQKAEARGRRADCRRWVVPVQG
jgi:hypothetical protein